MTADKCYQASVNTLTLAQMSRSIKNHVKVNLDETSSIMSGLREEISRLRMAVAKSNSPNKEDIVKMQELIKDLQVAKQQTWEEKETLSARYEAERKTNLANKVTFFQPGMQWC